jgi:hypothetical protein
VGLISACDRGPAVPEGAREESLEPEREERAAPRGMEDNADGELDSVAGLFWAPPEGFERRRPSSPMRVVEYALLGEGGRMDAQMGVFHFPGMGGDTDANVERWRGQFRGADGNPPEVRRETRSVGAIEVTIVSMEGTYDPGPMAGGSPGGEGMKLIGAIVPRPEGPVFFKLVGRAQAIDAARPAFDGMIESFRAR